MGKSNAAMKEYVGRKERFADLFNYILFQGELVIRPGDLEPVDGESDIIIDDKEEIEQEIHRYRDITMRWKYGCNFTILACENQKKVHYAMPVRNMLYDSLSYVEQIKAFWKEKKDKKVTPEEYLSRFCKEDKLFPVITIVMYYGLEEWDASLDLYGMFQLDERFQNNKTFQKYISNYRINLIDVGNLESVEKFRTDLQIVLGMLQYRSNTEKLMDYVNNNKEFFRNIDQETFRAIREFLHSENKLKKVLATVESKGEEKVDMCKALDDLCKMSEEKGYERGKEETEQKMCKALDESYKKGTEEGYERGKKEAEQKMCKALEDWAAEERAEGRLEGREENLVALIRKKLEKGKSIIQIADEIEETEAVVKELMEKYGLKL